jgi:hypothetical protein
VAIPNCSLKTSDARSNAKPETPICCAATRKYTHEKKGGSQHQRVDTHTFFVDELFASVNWQSSECASDRTINFTNESPRSDWSAAVWCEWRSLSPAMQRLRWLLKGRQ